MLPVNENAREARQRHYPANPDIRLLNDALRLFREQRARAAVISMPGRKCSTQHPAGYDRRWTAATAWICLPRRRALAA